MHTVIADNRLFIIPLNPQAMFRVYKVALKLRDVTWAEQESGLGVLWGMKHASTPQANR